MKKVEIDDVSNEPNPLDVHDVRRPVSAALGAGHVAMNYFELGPGESFSGGLHTHHDQEEIFYVEDGTATFEVGREGEEVTVESGELIRFSPGEFQIGLNRSDERVVGWAIGAPGPSHDFGEIESVAPCRECSEETTHGLELTDDGRFELTCTECENSFAP